MSLGKANNLKHAQQRKHFSICGCKDKEAVLKSEQTAEDIGLKEITLEPVVTDTCIQ